MVLTFFRSSYTLTASLLPVAPTGSKSDFIRQRRQVQAILSELHRLIGQCGPRHWKIHATIAKDKLTVRVDEYRTPKHLFMWLFYLPSMLVEGRFRHAFAMRLSSLCRPQLFMDAALRQTYGDTAIRIATDSGSAASNGRDDLG